MYIHYVFYQRPRFIFGAVPLIFPRFLPVRSGQAVLAQEPAAQFCQMWRNMGSGMDMIYDLTATSVDIMVFIGESSKMAFIQVSEM